MFAPEYLLNPESDNAYDVAGHEDIEPHANWALDDFADVLPDHLETRERLQ